MSVVHCLVIVELPPLHDAVPHVGLRDAQEVLQGSGLLLQPLHLAAALPRLPGRVLFALVLLPSQGGYLPPQNYQFLTINKTADKLSNIFTNIKSI